MTRAKNIGVSGGHLGPALAIIEELEKKKAKIVFLGRKTSFDRDDNLSLEYLAIGKRGIIFEDIEAPRFPDSFTLVNGLIFLLKFVRSLVKAMLVIRRQNIDKVIGFGSYVSLPCGIAAFLLGKKVALHEQTRHLGKANKILALFAEKVFLTASSSLMSGGKYITVGLPLRESSYICKSKNNVRELAFGERKIPLIYITGGSTGSALINKAVRNILPDLLPNFRILHQTGRAFDMKDYRQMLSFRDLLPKKIRENYFCVPEIDPVNLGCIYKEACLAVSRSGANTVYELHINNLRSVLVPLDNKNTSEQYDNACFLRDKGLALILLQSKMSGEMLLEKIKEALMLRQAPHKADFSREKIRGSAQIIVRYLVS